MGFPIMFFKVRDRSMEPAIKENDYLLVSSIHAGLKKGDVIVLNHPAKGIRLVKRITDIDDSSLSVAGDNSAFSEDSRSFGKIKIGDVIGKVLLVI